MYSMDGNHSHCKGHTLLCIGVVQHASLDASQRLHPIAWAILPGDETPASVEWAVKVVDDKRRARGLGPLGRTWMMDGGIGLRRGIGLWNATSDAGIDAAFGDITFTTAEDEHIEDPEPREGCREPLDLRMCYFHMVCKVREKSHLLPKGKVDLEDIVLEDVRLLAGTPDEVFSQAWHTVACKWARKGYTAFLQYFAQEWIEEKPGWNMMRGLPRTNNALEGLWPMLHLLAEGKGNFTTLASCLLERVIPYYLAGGGERWQMPVVDWHVENSTRGLTLRERQEAVRLAEQSAGCTMIHDGGYWYCKPRVLGMQRPIILPRDVEAFKAVRDKTTPWTEADFLAYHAVRCFDSTICICARGWQTTCYHQRAAAIIEGRVFPTESERPPPETAEGGAAKYVAEWLRDTFDDHPCKVQYTGVSKAPWDTGYHVLWMFMQLQLSMEPGFVREKDPDLLGTTSFVPYGVSYPHTYTHTIVRPRNGVRTYVCRGRRR